MEFMIIEGPAGSGKSYVSQLLTKKSKKLNLVNDPDYIQLFRPRSYDGEWGIELSMFKDMTFLAIGVADYLKTSRLQVVDRCLLSQLVYGSIRAGHLFINPVNTALMLISAEEIVRSMILNLRSRKFDTELNYDREVELVTFNFLILLPEIELLRSQRIRAGKDYPFDPIVELTRYKGLSSTLTMVAQDFLVQNDSTDRSMIQLRLLEVEFKDYDQLNKTLSKANLLP